MILTNYGIHNRRYDPCNNSYHDDMEGAGVICLAVDILPTEFSKEVLPPFSFLGTWAFLLKNLFIRRCKVPSRTY
jgi:hypothetical protein